MAYKHLRGAEHLASISGAPLWQCQMLLSGVAEAVWGRLSGWEADLATASLVMEHDGVQQLWSAGIHPSEIAPLAAPARGIVEALPVSYYLERVYGEVDVRWFRTVLKARPDAETAGWLASIGGPTHAASAAEWARWLGFGLPRDDVRRAVESGLAADFIVRIAAQTGWPQHTVARAVVAFADIDTKPSPAHFAVMRSCQVEDPRPAGRAVDEIVTQVNKRYGGRSQSGLPSRTELAVMLTILGTKQDVTNAIGRGVRSALELTPEHLGSSPLLA